MFSLRNLLVVSVGGFLVWQNRFRIQKTLESYGIKTPFLTGSLGDTVQSGAAKAIGSVEYAIKPATDDRRVAS
jgi:hypothetical protein